MNIKKLIAFQIILSAAMWALPSFSADLTIDTLKNKAFENQYYKNEEPKQVTLFGKKKEKTEEKAEVVKVERFEDNSFEKNNLTNEEYVKKFKRPEKKSIRKHQFDITIEQKDQLDEKDDQLAGDVSTEEDGSVRNVDPSDKKFFSRAKKQKAKNKKTAQKDAVDPSNLILIADKTEYFPDRGEVEATGNAKLEITGQDFTLYADKLILNHEINTVRAYDNVKIIQADNVTTGDFVNIDMTTAHGWIQKPVASNYSVRVKAEEAYVYPDKVEEYDGVANIIEDKRILIGGQNVVNSMGTIMSNLEGSYVQQPEPTVVKLKVKKIHVSSENGHNVVKLKDVSVYYKKFKLGMLPSIRLVTDKEQAYMQTNVPEIGSEKLVGMYVGPSIVLNTPLSSTLRLAPLLVYSTKESKFGVGGAAQYMSASNTTELLYGSAENKFLLRGYQSITDNLRLNYSQNTYVSQWFMGSRRPRYGLDLEYKGSYYIRDLAANFEHRISAGAYADHASISKYTEGRLRWMAQLSKKLLTYTNKANTFSMDLGIIGQSSLSQYTTGDTFGVVRIGPSVTTTYKRWSQNVTYFQSGVTGKTPFAFDDYYYGKSNLQIYETLKLNKYLSIGYLASMSLMGRESYSHEPRNNKPHDFLQENMFLVSIGPEEAKFTLGYDAYRQSTNFYFTMLLGTKDMDIAFKQATVLNPDTLMGENENIPWIKRTFNNVRYKVFPATNPKFDRSTLYPKEVIPANGDGIEEDEIEMQDQKELHQQINNNLAPFIQQQELMKRGL